MKTEKSRSAERIFADMHRQLRALNPQVPESLERLDPILRIMLQLYSSQLERIDGRIDLTWTNAANALIRSLSPEGRRWPVPAYTVMECVPADPVVDVDPDTLFIYKGRREGSATLFFSPLKAERILKADIRYMLAVSGDEVLDLKPSDSDRSMGWKQRLTEAAEIVVGIAFEGPPSAMTNAHVFVTGHPDAQKQLQWATWVPSTGDGQYDEAGAFVPGIQSNVDRLVSVGRRGDDWGSLRRGKHVFRPLRDSFVAFGERFVAHFQPGEAPAEVAGRLPATDDDPDIPVYWVKLRLPSGGRRERLADNLKLSFSSFVVVNKRELTAFKHTGANRLVEIEIPEEIDTLIEITSVSDSLKRDYVSRDHMEEAEGTQTYAVEERDNRVVLWFDFSNELELPPDSITVRYTVTAGTEANGISVGEITELYDPHPGIDETVNITSATGAVPAKTEAQIVREAAIRLRQRDRALTFADICQWAKAFDPRILSATCSNGIMRGERGLRRCIVVQVRINREDFYSDDEINLLKRRLNAFLKSRSPVNTQFQIEVAES